MGRYRDLHVGSYGFGWIKSVFIEEQQRMFSRLKQGIQEFGLKKKHRFFCLKGGLDDRMCISTWKSNWFLLIFTFQDFQRKMTRSEMTELWQIIPSLKLT